MVGGFTCSAAASVPIVIGPAKASTDSADSCAPVTPEAASSLRTKRNRRIAAACSWSATCSVRIDGVFAT
jgi:hypothetical protein